MSLQPDFQYELESEDYWGYVEATAAEVSEGYLLTDVHVRPMFQVYDLEFPSCEYEVEHDGDCICQLT